MQNKDHRQHKHENKLNNTQTKPSQDIPKIQPRGLGAKVSSKVTPAERELIKPIGTSPANNIKYSSKGVDNSAESGIMKAKKYTRKQADECIKNGLSIYAAEGHYDDFIAESFSEYYGSKKPRSLCLNTLKKIFKMR